MDSAKFPTMESPSCSDAQSTSDQLWLNIVNGEQLRQFLQEILPKFVEVVDPQTSGLLDILVSAQLLTDTDHESMSGKDVYIRKVQARKLWVFLNKMSVSDFQNTVAPELLKSFRHIIPATWATNQPVDLASLEQGRECFTHSMMSRVRASTMADVLCHHGCLSFEDYEDIISEEFDKDLVWARMLESCTGLAQSHTGQLVDGLRTLLSRYNLQPPQDLERLVTRGFPCHCAKGIKAVLPSASPFPSRRLGSWVKKSPFGCRTPRSSGSSLTRVDLKSYSGATSNLDSQSLSSEDPLVPDHTTNMPVYSAHVPCLVVMEEKEGEATPLMMSKPSQSVVIDISEDVSSPTDIETNNKTKYSRDNQFTGSLKVEATQSVENSSSLQTNVGKGKAGVLDKGTSRDSACTPLNATADNTDQCEIAMADNVGIPRYLKQIKKAFCLSLTWLREPVTISRIDWCIVWGLILLLSLSMSDFYRSIPLKFVRKN